MSFWFAGGMAVMSGVGAVMDGNAANSSAEASQEATRRRYLLKSKNAENQMEEQKSLAMEKMTEVTRAFLKNRGTAKVVQAETMVSGNVAKRLKHSQQREASEEKGQVAKVTNANIVNIAQSMISEKVDSEAMLMEAENRKKSTMQIAMDAGLAAGGSFVSAGGMAGFTEPTIKQGKTGTKQTGTKQTGWSSNLW